jgi:hypothetical protein
VKPLVASPWLTPATSGKYAEWPASTVKPDAHAATGTADASPAHAACRRAKWLDLKCTTRLWFADAQYSRTSAKSLNRAPVKFPTSKWL